MSILLRKVFLRDSTVFDGVEQIFVVKSVVAIHFHIHWDGKIARRSRDESGYREAGQGDV